MDQKQITERLERCYTGIVHDIMRAMGFKDFTLPPELKPILPGKPLAGPAFTIEGRVDRNADPHETLLAWTGLLSQAHRGHVWVCRTNTDYVALMGELSAQALQLKDIRGCIIDGLVRDVEFLIEQGFQTWCRGYTPRDIVGYWLPKAVDTEILIGDVWIAPGDFIVSDRDGVIRIPKDRVLEILDKAETAMATESDLRKAILAGMDPQQAYLKYGKF
ncbi:MAG: RraA family protein [Hyphomicrobiaceae bacterium]